MAKNSWVNNTPADPLVVTIAPEANDFLVAGSVSDGSGTNNTTITGWTRLGSVECATGDGGSIEVWHKLAAGNETSISIPRGATIAGVVSESGIDTDNPLDVPAVINSTTTQGTTYQLSITPQTNGCKIVVFAAVDGPSGDAGFSIATVSGTTGSWNSVTDQNSGFLNCAFFDCVQQTAGPITIEVTTSGTGGTGGHLMAIYALRPSGNSYNESLSESVASGESVTGNLGGGAVGLSDTVAVAERAGIVAGFFQRDFFQTDFFQVFDASGATYTEPVSDTVSASEQASVQEAANAPISDSHSVTDQLVPTLTGTITLAELLGLVENAVATGTSVALVLETLGIEENASAGFLAALALAEALAKGENIAAGGTTTYTEALGETVATSDAFSHAVTFGPGVAEALGLTEAQASKLTTILAVAETLSKSEGIAGNLQASLALAEAIASVEDLLASRLTLQALSDSLGLGESQTAGIVLAALLADTVANDGSIASLVSAIQGVAETGNVGDGISTGGVNVYTITLDDGTELSEQASAAVQILAGLTDSGGLAEALAHAVTFSPAVAEAHGLTEQQTSQMSQMLALTDQLTDAATMSGGLRFAAGVLEQCQVADELAAGLQARQDLLDNNAVQDALASYQDASQALGEAMGVTDDATAGRLQTVDVIEALAIADAALAAQQALAQLNEAVASAEAMVAVGGALPDVINNAVRAAVAIECVTFAAVKIECVTFAAVKIECVPPIAVYPIA